MARIKRSVWGQVFKKTVTTAKRLIKHPDQLRQMLEEALSKTQKHSGAIREILGDLQIIVRLVKAWLAGEYKDIALKSILILIGAILYFLNPFDAVPDALPVIGYVDDVSVVAWVLKTLKDEIEKFRSWKTWERDKREGLGEERDHRFIIRDKAGVDIFWLRDESLEESANLTIPMLSLRKSLKTSKPPSNNSAKSPLT
jgi:uncharacterized membrane protein YkvA (DUF1232 family)